MARHLLRFLLRRSSQRLMHRILLTALVLGVGVSAHAGTIAGGAQHTVVVKADGSVWTWGGNGNGQLGDGTTVAKRVPTQLASLSGVTAVAAGASHTLILCSDGRVRAWGANADGQLGDGTITQRTSPVLLSLTSIVAIAAGDYHSVALGSDGTVWTWGRNSNGQLGDGTTTRNSTPRAVAGITASAVSAGATHTAIVKTDGTAWAWGGNANGQLGDGSTTQRLTPVQMLGSTSAASVVAGGSHTLVLGSDGSIRATGKNNYGQLGDGTTTQRTSLVDVTLPSACAALAAGQSHSVALLSDGTVRTWGYNASGQLGDGSTTNRSVPTSLSLASIVAIGAGQSHTLAVSTDGIVSVWGTNAAGQFGDGTTASSSVPVAISGAASQWKVATPVFNVAAGTYTSARSVTISTLTPGATIHYTTTGDDPTESDPVPSGAVVVDHTLTLKANAWKAGQPTSNVASALYVLQVTTPTFSPGTGTYTTAQFVTINDSTSGAEIRYTTDGSDPVETSLAYAGPVSVSTGQALKAKGFKTDWAASATATATYTFNYGTLGRPVASPDAGQYSNDLSVSLSADAGATIRFTTNGSDPTSSSTIYSGPILISSPLTLKAKAFRPDWTTSATLTCVYSFKAAAPTLSLPSGTYTYGTPVIASTATDGGTLHYTLNGADPVAADPVIPSGGALPLGNFTLKVSAWRSGFTTSDVVAAAYTLEDAPVSPTVAAGASHSLLLRNDGTLWAWGGNTSGQLGDGTKTQRPGPVIVAGVTGIAAIAAGQTHSLALTADGHVWTWGSNTYGQLGDGTTTQNSLPRQVSGLDSVVAIAAGQDFSVALRQDGTVWAWGQNANGQIGDGTTTRRTTPTANGLSGISAIAAGATHAVALSSDGTLWAWGLNSNGQLGDGTLTQRTAPVHLTAPTGVTKVAAGWVHTMAIGSGGELWTWGQNTNGQLGDGTTTRRTTATLISMSGPVSSVCGGQSHTLAITADGLVWSWGANGSGQLADGTTAQRTSPAVVIELAGIAGVAAGQSHGLALSSDGIVRTWGANGSGQVGDGTAVQRTHPTALSDAQFVWKVATPTFSVASGTYSTVQNVTLSTVTPGATIHYTTTGLDPTEADDVATAPIVVDHTTTLRAGAWKAGVPPSNIDTFNYTLQVATPSFTPGAGTYTTAQSVTMATSTTGAIIRYTTDGSDPVDSSPPYTAVITLSTGTTLKAKAFKEEWSASAVRTAAYSFNYGTLAPPTMTPGAGTYGDDVTVTLEAPAGTTIRYTLNGADPTSSSAIYTDPLILTTTKTVKAKAFQQDWTASPTSSAIYTIQVAAPDISPTGGQYDGPQLVTLSTTTTGAELRYTLDGTDPTAYAPLYTAPFVVGTNKTVKAKGFRSGCTASAISTVVYTVVDVTPPTITAQVSPAPNAAGWNKTAPTVTFTCADSGLPAASCTPPVSMMDDGQGIEVQGEAVDAVGNRATLTVLVNVDRSAPRLAFYTPEQGDFLPTDTTSTVIRGNVLESMSGIDTVTCGSASGTIEGQSFTCEVPVVLGSNSVIVTARDAAGNERAATLNFSVSDPPAATSIEITPARMTMFAGESREVRVLDNRGKVVLGGTWTVDQPLVAQVTVEENKTKVTAIGSGEATLTLTRDGLSTQGTVTVLAIGVAAPSGTVLWESSSLPEASVKRGQVLRANRSDDGEAPSADLFFVDEGSEWGNDWLYRREDRPTRIWATTFDGQRLWSKTITPGPTGWIKDLAVDSNGGLLIVWYSSYDGPQPRPQHVQRLDGATGKTSWEYSSDDGSLSELAVRQDGTIFVVDEEYHTAYTYLVSLDPQTGAPRRWSLPYRYFRPYSTGPVVREDGSVAVLFDPHDDDTCRHLMLATVPSEGGGPTFSDIYRPSQSCYVDLSNYRLIPSGNALLVGQVRGEADLFRIGPDNTVSAIVPLLPRSSYIGTVMDVDYAVSDSGGAAFIKVWTGAPTREHLVYGGTFDPVTLSSSVSGTPSRLPSDLYTSFRFITADGSAYYSGETSANETQVAPGLWAALGQTAAVKIGQETEPHFSSVYLRGGIDSTNGASLRIYVPQPLQTEPNQGTIRTTIVKVKAALLTEGDPPPTGSCGAWLGTGEISGTAMTDLLLLKERFEGQEMERFGHGVFSSVPDRIVASSAQNSIAAFVGARNWDKTPVGVPIYFAVTFNDYGAFFAAFDRNTGKEFREGPYRGGTSQAQARILIHEMAHMLSVPGFLPDALSPIAGANNDRLVEQHCGPLVGGIR